jgi:hypothetical protein
MDAVIAREVLTNLVEGYERLGGGEHEIARARALLAKLPDYRINREGAIAEWIPPDLADDYDHRHLSHLYELYDGATDRIAGNTELREAFRRALELRMPARRRERGGQMAFGLAQIGLVAASLGDRGLTREALGFLSSSYWRNSLVSTHDPGALFNVDLCGGLPALLMRLLVDARPGTIELCKALPHDFPRGSLSGVLCRGQIRITCLTWHPSGIELSLESQAAQRVRVCLPRGALRFTSDPEAACLEREADSTWAIALEARRPVQLTAVYQ